MFRYTLIITLLIFTAIANYSFSTPGTDLNRRPLSKFPRVIGEWKTVNDQFIDDASMSILLVDDYIMRTYMDSKGETVGLYIGYFENQREGKQVHSPRQCLPGAGWKIIEQKVYLLRTVGRNSRVVSINYFLMGKGINRDLYLWWYQGRGRIYANEYLNKIYLILDALMMHRTDGALVRINTSIIENPEIALNRELEFIKLIQPTISNFIPE